MPDFTIVTPVLNQVQQIEKCILSVLGQNCDVQYIIIDGGSTDGTVDIIRKYKDRISYWESKPDRGQSHATNKGLAIAEGTFFNWLNADDQLTENALKNVIETTSEETQVVVGKCEHIDENGNRVAIGGARIWDSLEATLGNYSMGQPSVFYRTELMREFEGVNAGLHYCMDMDLWFRFLTEMGQKNIQTTEKVLSKFLVHDESKSSLHSEKMNTEKYGIYHALLTEFELPEILTQFFTEFPVPKSVQYSLPADLNQNELFSQFAWHLMVDAYGRKQTNECSAYLDMVKKGSRLSTTEVLQWKARIASIKFLKQ
ncbi:MAG TPA: hypothetical protein DCR04_00360 [Flavobacteriales bacterium]|nr:hypothetical protein [Flavobacteriales bacterium]